MNERGNVFWLLSLNLLRASIPLPAFSDAPSRCPLRHRTGPKSPWSTQIPPGLVKVSLHLIWELLMAVVGGGHWDSQPPAGPMRESAKTAPQRLVLDFPSLPAELVIT
jgi:hypothetical protein